MKSIAGASMVGQHENSCQLLNTQNLRSVGLEPDYVFRTNDNATVSAMVKAGLGLAVQPLLCVEQADPDLSLHSLKPALPDREVVVAWRTGRTLSPVAQAFIDTAREVADDIVARRVLPA